ncbi:hypothetical protein C8J55DRAFT_494197 [Lentinula edodes]|uniref:Uncharacterized protein n=1 Tax=Lentinula lateritia TaxID=40482 RepID=A0A9W8ZQI5_9AGAR|nr:hypothetical protein C8J55DRAFT_494197 [Lentinula edodes]
METCQQSMDMATATLNSLVENFETFQEAMRSSIESMKRGYGYLLCSGKMDDSIEFPSPYHFKVLSLQRLTQILKCKIFLATLEKPLVNLAIVLPSMDSTCQLLFSALCDLYTSLSPVAKRTKLEMYMALIRGPIMVSSMEMEAYSLVFAPLLTQTAKITEILRTLKKEYARFLLSRPVQRVCPDASTKQPAAPSSSKTKFLDGWCKKWLGLKSTKSVPGRFFTQVRCSGVRSILDAELGGHAFHLISPEINLSLIDNQRTVGGQNVVLIEWNSRGAEVEICRTLNWRDSTLIIFSSFLAIGVYNNALVLLSALRIRFMGPVTHYRKRGIRTWYTQDSE